VAFEILGADLLVSFALPDVAHDAAAVASAMSVEDKDGQACEPYRKR
jgi:hypothetical protein